jgi:uncharacterized protein (TIGR02646 family)
MRKIEKEVEPKALTEWRCKFASDVNFGYQLLPGTVRDEVKEALMREQGWLCAYSGQPIDMTTSHVEHLFPQDHCSKEESVAYQNMVACFPGPNSSSCGYGATVKANWPSAEERPLFVSPLTEDCESRFKFSARGKISPTQPSDEAASETIRRLKLDNKGLEMNRKAAVAFVSQLSRKETRIRLAELASETGRRSAYCFALRQVLEKHLVRLDAIQRNTAR